MLNQVILVGKVVEDIDVNLLSNEKSKLVIEVEVKNDNQTMCIDRIPCMLSNELALRVSDYCKVGMTVGVKAKIRIVKGEIEIQIEKITFINESDH
jgi:single-stranded DNA-binding protein